MSLPASPRHHIAQHFVPIRETHKSPIESVREMPIERVRDMRSCLRDLETGRVVVKAQLKALEALTMFETPRHLREIIFGERSRWDPEVLWSGLDRLATSPKPDRRVKELQSAVDKLRATLERTGDAWCLLFRTKDSAWQLEELKIGGRFYHNENLAALDPVETLLRDCLKESQVETRNTPLTDPTTNTRSHLPPTAPAHKGQHAGEKKFTQSPSGTSMMRTTSKTHSSSRLEASDRMDEGSVGTEATLISSMASSVDHAKVISQRNTTGESVGEEVSQAETTMSLASTHMLKLDEVNQQVERFTADLQNETDESKRDSLQDLLVSARIQRDLLTQLIASCLSHASSGTRLPSIAEG
jgi:hypothetical protein